MNATDEAVRCRACNAGPGRQAPVYDGGAATGRFRCEVCGEVYDPSTLTLLGVSRMSKAALRALIEKDARERGRRFLVGGPKDMSHDELVRYVVHETTLLPDSERPGVTR